MAALPLPPKVFRYSNRGRAREAIANVLHLYCEVMMMTAGKSKSERFPTESVSDALERSLRNAKHLRAKDAATVAAARALAWKIDHWDELAEQAISDAEVKGKGARPAVPLNDNTSIPTFLKYCAALGLTPEEEKPAKTVRAKSVNTEETPVADELEEYLAKIS